MAILSGIGGNCSVAGHTGVGFRDWTANITTTEIDTTIFGDTHKKVIGGLQGGTFTANGLLELDSGSPAPGDASNIELNTLQNVVLTTATACTLTADALITQQDFSVAVSGEATSTLNGTFNGAIALAWDDS